MSGMSPSISASLLATLTTFTNPGAARGDSSTSYALAPRTDSQETLTEDSYPVQARPWGVARGSFTSVATVMLMSARKKREFHEYVGRFGESHERRGGEEPAHGAGAYLERAAEFVNLVARIAGEAARGHEVLHAQAE